MDTIHDAADPGDGGGGGGGGEMTGGGVGCGGGAHRDRISAQFRRPRSGLGDFGAHRDFSEFGDRGARGAQFVEAECTEIDPKNKLLKVPVNTATVMIVLLL